jgi:AraC-like DNA-binding protein
MQTSKRQLQDETLATLKRAVVRYADMNANYDGLALTPVEGLRMMCMKRPAGPMHSIYKPLICLILQGAKQMTIGDAQREFSAGQSVVVTLDVPVAGRVVTASAAAPYAAVAIELDMALVREIESELGGVATRTAAQTRFFALDTDHAALDCAMRLMRLVDTPDAIATLRPAIMKELHFWLVSGRHGDEVRNLALPDSHAERLGSAIRLLRTDYRHRLSLERLAAAAGMSISTFGRRFKAMTSLTPLQFQKHLRLVEARRLMLGEGSTVTNAAFAVGYESAAHFSRDYARLFGTSPKRDALAASDSSRATGAAHR